MVQSVLVQNVPKLYVYLDCVGLKPILWVMLG